MKIARYGSKLKNGEMRYETRITMTHTDFLVLGKPTAAQVTFLPQPHPGRIEIKKVPPTWPDAFPVTAKKGGGEKVLYQISVRDALLVPGARDRIFGSEEVLYSAKKGEDCALIELPTMNRPVRKITASRSPAGRKRGVPVVADSSIINFSLRELLDELNSRVKAESGASVWVEDDVVRVRIEY